MYFHSLFGKRAFSEPKEVYIGSFFGVKGSITCFIEGEGKKGK
jgi:hypothetical protein